MKRLVKFLTVLFLLMLDLTGMSSAQEAMSQSVQELFLKSGFDHLTHQLPILFQQGIEQAYEQDPDLNWIRRLEKGARSSRKIPLPPRD